MYAAEYKSSSLQGICQREKTHSIVYAWMRSAIGLFLFSILVSLEGTFPSARDLSLGKSLRVKRHDWLAELIQRKFILLARNLC